MTKSQMEIGTIRMKKRKIDET